MTKGLGLYSLGFVVINNCNPLRLYNCRRRSTLLAMRSVILSAAIMASVFGFASALPMAKRVPSFNVTDTLILQYARESTIAHECKAWVFTEYKQSPPRTWSLISTAKLSRRWTLLLSRLLATRLGSETGQSYFCLDRSFALRLDQAESQC